MTVWHFLSQNITYKNCPWVCVKFAQKIQYNVDVTKTVILP